MLAINNVDNTTDLNKPVSTATATAISAAGSKGLEDYINVRGATEGSWKFANLKIDGTSAIKSTSINSKLDFNAISSTTRITNISTNAVESYLSIGEVLTALVNKDNGISVNANDTANNLALSLNLATFTKPVVHPDATSNNQSATKGQMDTEISTAGSKCDEGSLNVAGATAGSWKDSGIQVDTSGSILNYSGLNGSLIALTSNTQPARISKILDGAKASIECDISTANTPVVAIKVSKNGQASPAISFGTDKIYSAIPVEHAKATTDNQSVTRVQVRENGTTANRPTESPDRTIGKFYYDTTLNKPIWWNGTVWKDANGTTV
jgi:hypothetical protein